MTGLFFSTPVCFALVPEDLPIPGEGTPNPGTIKPSSIHTASASATISDTEVTVYFNFPVGNALITVTDGKNQPVFQDVVDTELMSEEIIPIGEWPSDIYTLTVTYGSVTQKGSFQIQ